MSKRTCDCSVCAAVSKADLTPSRSAALTMVPPPALAKLFSTAWPASFLNATTSARTFPCCSARSAAASCDFSLAAPPSSSATVSSPSLSSTMLRSPSVPRAATPFCTPAYSEVSPLARRPFTTLCTFLWSVVGLRSTPAVLAKLTTPTFTSGGTWAKKSLTAALTVDIPAGPIEPLVSMTSIVLRGWVVAGDSLTTADLPSTRAMTWVVSIFAGSTPRMTRAPVTCPLALRTSLIVPLASADAIGDAMTSAEMAAAATPAMRATCDGAKRVVTDALRR